MYEIFLFFYFRKVLKNIYKFVNISKIILFDFQLRHSVDDIQYVLAIIHFIINCRYETDDFIFGEGRNLFTCKCAQSILNKA